MNLIMDCSRSSNVDRDLDISDDSHSHHSHDDHSDENDDMRDCDSVDGEINLNNSIRSGISTGMDFGVGDGRSPEPSTDMSMSHGHHTQFPPNHPLGALGNFMGMAGLHGLPNLQHGDVLEKIKMQVRDLKVGLMDQDYSTHNGFGANSLTTPVNTAFTLPPTTLNNFSHSPQNLSQSHSQPPIQSPLSQQQLQQQTQNSSQTSHTNGFSFTSPTPPSTKDANPASNSSTSSETSNSSQQNNGWSFEEQYKQVRQLYEINDDPKRKEFLDDLFSFMQKRGTPINRLPIMAKSVLDLYELYNLVIARGGLVDVINKKLWQEIIKGLHLPSSITSAAFTLRTQYMKYLYPYECEKKNLSSPSELQAAIDGNRREGRRSSYGQFEAMHSQLQMPQMQRGNGPSGIPQMSPLALVTHSNAAQAAAAHHRLMTPSFGQVPNLVTHELEQRMMEYLKLIQAQKEQQPRPRSQSPETTTREALNALEMSRVALWSMYHNNTSPPSSVNTSPQGIEPQREALNLSDSPPSVTIKRERDITDNTLSDREDFNQPPAKRGIGANFHLPSPALNSSSDFNHHHHQHHHRLQHQHDDEHDDDEDDERNSALNSSHDNIDNDHQMNVDEEDKPSHHLLRHQKASPSTSYSSTSPIKHHLTNGISNNNNNTNKNHNNNNNNNTADQSFMSGMQFKISRRENGPNGEQQLVVNMELNGIQYEGILFANVTTTPTINGNEKHLTPSPIPQGLPHESPEAPIPEPTVAAIKKDVIVTTLDERTTPRLVSS